MRRQTESEQTILNEMIENAAILSLESQYLVLMMAKAMRYTRSCVKQNKAAEQLRKAPRQITGS